jgi:hypothetical protein
MSRNSTRQAQSLPLLAVSDERQAVSGQRNSSAVTAVR